MAITIDGTGTISGVSSTGLSAAQLVNASNITTGTLPFAQLPTGSVLQVVNASSTTNATTTSASLVTTGFSATITPKFNNSKILVLVNAASFNGTLGAYQQYAVFRGATNITSTSFGYCAYSSTGALATIIPIIVYDSPATTSATTYTLYFGASTGTTSLNPNTTSGIPTTITLMEIAG